MVHAAIIQGVSCSARNSVTAMTAAPRATQISQDTTTIPGN